MAPEAVEIEEQVTEAVDPTEILEPSVATRVQVIGQDDYIFKFEQEPLSFFGKLDFFSVMGKALDRAMSGPDGISISDLLDVPERGEGGISAEDLKDADTFVRGISKLITNAPELIGDLYCSILEVPRGQREAVKQIMGLKEKEGGLSDADGVEILKVFVEQNWEVMRDFFTERIAPLLETVGKKISPESQSSKP